MVVSYVFLGYDASELVHPHFAHSLYWGLLLKNCFWQSNLSNHMSACFTGAVGRDPTCAVLCSSPWQMLPSFCLPFKNLGKFCFEESNNIAVSVSRCDGSSFFMQSFKKDSLLFLYRVVYPKMLLISESSFQQVTDSSYKSPTKPLQNPPTYFLRQNAAHSVKKYIGWIHNVFFRRSIALLSSHSLH